MTDQILEVEVGDVEGALAWLGAREGVREAYLSGAMLHVNVGERTDPSALADDLRAGGFDVTRCEPVEPTIEDVFVHLVTEQREGDRR
jgi:ABC-2 type transport system ATP-binding protein